MRLELRKQKFAVEPNQEWFGLEEALLLGVPKPVRTILLNLIRAHDDA